MYLNGHNSKIRQTFRKRTILEHTYKNYDTANYENYFEEIETWKGRRYPINR